MNLYDTLGIRRDASTADVRNAYRAKAKQAHPDAGGTAEAFEELERAARILSDPHKRLTYDRTGQAEEPPPDNETALALQMIQAMIAAAISRDVPPHIDILTEMKTEARRVEAEAVRANADLERKIARLEKLAKRFSIKAGPNFIARMIETSINEHRRGIAGGEQRISVVRKVLAMLEGYQFAAEPVSAYASQLGGFGQRFGAFG